MPEIPQPDDFPTAQVAPTQGPLQLAGRLNSRLWILTLVCLLVALGLVLAQWFSSGKLVQIEFAEGNGLKPGDLVRYRGIDVGKVVSVLLNRDLDRATVTVRLNPESSSLAREGARFWIERPDLRLGQVRGLDTLFGGRYVGVLPGPADARSATRFEGLRERPMLFEEDFNGLEIVLEAPQRSGLQRGSPVSYRGVQIGYIMDVGLTNDAASVVVRTFIRPEYRSLIRENSRFWAYSGINVNVGIGGVHINTDSLTAVVAGGVSVATPDTSAARVTTGHRFALHKSPEEDWLIWQPRLAIGSALLPDDVPIPAPVCGICRGERTLPLFRRTSRRGWLLLLDSGRLLGPADMLSSSDDENRILELWGATILLAGDEVPKSGLLAARKVPAELAEGQPRWPVARIKQLKADSELPAELIVTCGSDSITQPLSAERILVEDGQWKIDSRVPLDESWHGACVLSAADGLLVGIAVSTPTGMVIERIDERLLHEE